MRLKQFFRRACGLWGRGLLLAFALLGLGAGSARASSVSLAWDPSPENGVVGYRVYRGTSSGSYDWVLDVGPSTVATITDLVPGTTLYFAVTAYNAPRVETAPSNEVIYHVPLLAGLPPLAIGALGTVGEDGSLAIQLTGVSLSGTALTYEIISPPANGTLSGTPPNVTYRPARDFYGPDSFTFRTRDAAHPSLPAIVALTVTPVNDVPVALPQVVNLPAGGGRYLLNLDGTDVDGDPISFIIQTQPAHGELGGFLPELAYTPDPGYSGTDFLTFVATDGLRESAPARVDFRITASGPAPQANAGTLTLLEDSSVGVVLTGSDPGGLPLTFTVVEFPGKGTLTGTAPNLTFRPDPNATGTDSFQFTVSNGSQVSAPAVVTLNITQVNDVPTAGSKSLTLPEDGLINLFLAGADVDGDALTYRIVRQPALGTLSGTAPSLIYRPDADVTGTDSFTYTVSDKVLTSTTATFTFSITPVNDAPVAAPQAVRLALNTPTSVTLAGSDVDDDALTYRISKSPTNGVLSGTPPLVRYTPRTGFSGTDTFFFTASDGLLISAPAAVALTVTGSSGVPTAKSLNLVMAEDSFLNVRLSGTDPQGDALTYQIVSAPTSGALSGAGTDWVYQPDPNFFGSDSFTYTVSDGARVSAAATVAISVTAVNDAPKANVKSVNVNEDGLINVFLGGSDVDGDALTFVMVSGPTLGTLSGTIPSLVYRPLPNVSGADFFTYSASDGRLTSTATFTINILPANDAPVALAQSASVSGGSFVTVVLAGSDPDADRLTFAVVQAPSNGVLSGIAPNLRYTPRSGYAGADSFTFTASDGVLTSSPATVSLTVTAPVNGAPSAQLASLALAEDTSIAVRLSGADPEGSALTYRVVTSPTRGALSGVAPNLTYTPHANFFGTDSFGFTVSDGVSTSTVAAITLTVTAVNDVPVAANKSLTLAEDGALSVVLSATDVEGDSLTYVVVRAPTRGTLSGTPPTLTYRPNPNATGADSFTYTASDGAGVSAVATVSVAITAANDPPVALSQSVALTGVPFADLTLVGSDLDGDPLTFTITSNPTNGTLTGVAPAVRYTPRLGYAGADAFAFSVSDGTTVSTPAVVALSVTPPQGTPVADAGSVVLNEDTTAAITLTGTDPDGEALTYLVTQLPTKGTLTGLPPSLNYRPSANFAGADSLVYTVSDGTSTSAPATIAITVNPVNDAPTVGTKSLSTPEDKAINVFLAGSDVDGDTLTFSLARSPLNGTLSGTPPTMLYRPNPHFNGVDTFTYTANDGSASSAVGSFTITVTRVNDVPVAIGQSLSTPKNEGIDLRLLASDADGDALTYTLSQAPTNGLLSGAFPDVRYTPAANFVGIDAIRFLASDGAASSAIATIAIQITPTNHIPVAENLEVTLGANQSAPVALSGSDADGEPLLFQIQSAPKHGVLTGTAPDLQYRPAPGYEGEDQFTYTVSDGALESLAALVSISVIPTNNAPSAVSSEVVLLEDSSATLRLNGSDPDGDALTYIITQSPAKGTIQGTPPSLTYRPSTNSFGTDLVKYVVTDGSRTSAVASVSLVVEPVNDAPRAHAKTVGVAEDGVANLFPGGSDADGDALSFAVVRPPANGTLSPGTPGLVYRPNANFNGTDSFTYTASDGFATSAAVTFTINVSPVNDAPIALAQSLSIPRGGSASVLLSGVDIEGSELVYLIVEEPTQGVLSGTGPSLTYTATNLTATSDTFRFTVDDGESVSVPATVTISLTTPAQSQLATAAAESRLGRVVALRVSGADVLVQLGVQAGADYVLEYREDWPDPSGPWISLQQISADQDGTVQVVDENGAGAAHRFYRLRPILRDR